MSTQEYKTGTAREANAWAAARAAEGYIVSITRVCYRHSFERGQIRPYARYTYTVSAVKPTEATR